MRVTPMATGRKSSARTGIVRAPASSSRRITMPHTPPVRWLIMSRDRQPIDTPVQKRCAKSHERRKWPRSKTAPSRLRRTPAAPATSAERCHRSTLAGTGKEPSLTASPSPSPAPPARRRARRREGCRPCRRTAGCPRGAARGPRCPRPAAGPSARRRRTCSSGRAGTSAGPACPGGTRSTGTSRGERRAASLFDFRDDPRSQTEQEAPRAIGVELRIARFDADEEAVLGGEGEGGHVEDRMVRLRQPVERERPQHGGEGREEDRGLEGGRNEGGPAVEGLAPDVHRVLDDRRPVLEAVPRHQPRDTAEEHQQRQARMVEAEGLGQRLERVGREGVDLAVARLVDLAGGGDDLCRVAEFGHEAVEAGLRHRLPSCGSAPGRIVLISKIEMAGKKRTKRKSRVTNRPRVPMKADQSKNVPLYIPHDEGRKSRWRL